MTAPEWKPHNTGSGSCYAEAMRPLLAAVGTEPRSYPGTAVGATAASSYAQRSGVKAPQHPGRGRIATPARLRARWTVDASTLKVFPTAASESPA